jgi:hypothetical protein
VRRFDLRRGDDVRGTRDGPPQPRLDRLGGLDSDLLGIRVATPMQEDPAKRAVQRRVQQLVVALLGGWMPRSAPI